MIADKNIKIEMIKLLVFKIHNKPTKEIFVATNYITDWHCKCPEHIETNKECKHIKLVKSWLGFDKQETDSKNNESIAEKRFNEVTFKLFELESKLDNLLEKKEDRLVVRGKSWDDAKIRLLYMSSKHNEGRFESMKKYFMKKGIEFKDLTEDELVEYGHIKDHLADLTVNAHRIFC